MSISRPNLHCESCQSRGESIFCNLETIPLHDLDSHKVSNHYRRHQVLFYEGQQPSGLYCVNSGKVKLYKSGQDGRNMIVRIAVAGDLVGYRALFSGEPYHATAEMVDEGDVCFVDKKTLFDLVARDPSLAMGALRMISHELGDAEEKLKNMSQKSVKERLAELLLIFKESVGMPVADGTLLEQRLTREEIGQLLGSAPETIIRMLHEFQDKKWLRLEGKQIVLTNLPALIEFARLEN